MRTFILDGYFGTFKDSAYVKNLDNFTLAALDDGFSWSLAEFELVAVAEGARAFVQGTYSLEGDGLCVLYCYDWITHLQFTTDAEYYPLIDQYIRKLVPTLRMRKRRRC